MKLYTEEQVIKAIELARLIREKDSAYDSFSVEDISGCTEVCTYGWGEKHSDDEIIESLKPIELPSDDEIEKAGYYCENKDCFIDGADWMKKQIIQNK